MTYLSAVNAAKNTLTDTGKLKILAALTQLRQVCCDPNLCFENYGGETSKLEACLELCSGTAANGHQILLFSQFTSMNWKLVNWRENRRVISTRITMMVAAEAVPRFSFFRSQKPSKGWTTTCSA